MFPANPDNLVRYKKEWERADVFFRVMLTVPGLCRLNPDPLFFRTFPVTVYKVHPETGNGKSNKGNAHQ